MFYYKNNSIIIATVLNIKAIVLLGRQLAVFDFKKHWSILTDEFQMDSLSELQECGAASLKDLKLIADWLARTESWTEEN